jgi:hypothetical protein
VRTEVDLVIRLKELAAIKGTGYQALLRQFVADRVYEEEKREGVVKQSGRRRPVSLTLS